LYFSGTLENDEWHYGGKIKAGCQVLGYR